MVTGIETAGLVLGSIPLLILAIEKWHKGFTKARAIAGLKEKDRKRMTIKIDGIATALKSHSGQINIRIKALLIAADPRLKLDSLPRDYRNELWKTSAVDTYLRRVGDEEAVEGFRGEIEASKRIIEEIGQHFSQGQETANPARGLRETCEILRRSRLLGFKERFGFTLKEHDIDRLTEDLRHVSISIASLIDGATNLEKFASQPLDDTSSMRIVNRLYKARNSALSLFNALKSVWKADCQHDVHNALLHLQSEYRSNDSKMKQDREFHILFQLLRRDDMNSIWSELTVVMKNDSLDTIPASTKTPRVNFTNEVEDVYEEVKDFCGQISQFSPDNAMMYLRRKDKKLCTLTKDTWMFCHETDKRQSILPEGPTLISLQTYLTADCRKLLSSKRIELAFKLACSMLQYNWTPWSARGWNKENIYFFSDQSKQSLIDIDHPLILESFPCTASSSAGLSQEPSDTLIEYAILLMELHHRTTFEYWVSKRFPEITQEALGNPIYREYYARRWLKEMPKCAEFFTVVRTCMTPHDLERDGGEESWEDEKWRLAFYKFIIFPLLKHLQI